MCDRKNIPDDMMKRLIDRALYDLYERDDAKNALRDKDIIALTADMIINNQEFGENLATRPTSNELGLALVRANKLGLRVIKGGK